MTEGTPAAANPVVFFDLALGGKYPHHNTLDDIQFIQPKIRWQKLQIHPPNLINMHPFYPLLDHMSGKENAIISNIY
jgi:hypothetical protein